MRSTHEAPWCNVVHPRVWAGPGWDALVSQGSHGWPKCIQCHFGSRLSKESNHLTHPPAPSGLRWPLAVPGRVGGQRSWSTSEREAVVRVVVGSDARGTGLANSQASVVPWIRASLAGLGMGRSALEALASCCGSGFPSRQGRVGPPLQLEGMIAGGFSREGGDPAHHRCAAVALGVPPWRRGIVLGYFDTGGRVEPCRRLEAPLCQAWRYKGSKAELDGELQSSVGLGWEKTS